MGNYLEVSGHVLIEVVICVEELRKIRKNLSISGVPDKIRTESFSNRALQLHPPYPIRLRGG
jgi:hypothetical protein